MASGIQGFRDSGIQGFRVSGIQDFSSSGLVVRTLGKCLYG
jgi:hypothetical protein